MEILLKRTLSGRCGGTFDRLGLRRGRALSDAAGRKEDDELRMTAAFYDYIEVQPPDNFGF
jgi:hypothetical protein